MKVILNNILVEWAYRVHDGKPNPNNHAHLYHLTEILIEYKWPMVVIDEFLQNLSEVDIVKKKQEDGSYGSPYTVKQHNPDKGQKLVTKDASPEDIKSKVKKGEDEKEDDVKGGENIKDTEAVETKMAETFKEETLIVLEGSDVPEHKRVKKLLEKLWSGKSLDKEEKKFLSKWVRVVEPTEGTKTPKYKLYVAYKEGHFSRNRQPAAEKIPKKDKTGKAAKEFHGWLQQNGIMTQRTSTLGGKKTTAAQTYTNEDGSTRLLGSEDEPAATVQRDTPDSPSTSITIGKQVIKRQDDKEPGISKKEVKYRRRHNRNLDEYARAIENHSEEHPEPLVFIDMNEGVIPDSPENRVTVIKGALSGMVKRIRELAEKPIAGQPAPPLDDEAQQILDDLEEFAKRDPNEDPEEWKKDLDALMSKLSNHEVLAESWANYAEVYVAVRDMQANGKGTENGACVLLPESQTLETVDAIVISTSGEGERKIVTLDGVSVKKGVGGASALTSKVEKSTFKPGGKKGEKVKKTVVKMSESHADIYKRKLKEGSVEDHKKDQLAYRKKLEERARRVGVSEEEIEKIRKKANSSKGQVANALKKIMKDRAAVGLSVDAETEEKIKQRLVSYYMYTFISHAAYNQNVDGQDFSNESVTSQEGQKGYGKGTIARARAGEGTVTVDSSDGVSILAYPKPEFNVGFTLDGRSKNPGSGRLHNAEKSE